MPKLLALVIVLALPGCSVLCPADVPMAFTTTEYGPYTTIGACDTARAATKTCSPIKKADAACLAYCKSGWYPGGCLGSATNAASTVGAACFPKQSDNQYYYACVDTATCHCV